MGNQNLEVKEVCEELKKNIIDSLELTKAKEEIDGSDLMNELNINSIDALEILVRIENTYDIIIPDEDLSAKLFESLEGLANYVIGRCKA